MENFDRLNYDQETGVFTWRYSPAKNVKTGDVAGSISGKGCLTIKYGGKLYRAHRVAWVKIYGKWPDGEIDHINGNRTDNRIVNLRDVTSSVNNQNQRNPMANNKSGFLGVTKTNAKNRWRATICVFGKCIHIGCFDSAEDASRAYLETKRKLHEGCAI